MLCGIAFAESRRWYRSILRAFLLSVCLSFAATPVCFGQAPPNDNFVDRIKLEGHSIFFTGNVAQATYEEWEEYEQKSLCIGTIWWSWTALESTPVILQAFDHQRDYFDVLAVYAPTNLDGFPTNARPPAVNKMKLDLAFPGEWISFSANAGMDYQIRLMGCGSYKFRLVATNNPVIFEQPKSLTVAPNAGVFFSVMAAGISPLNYQWQFNGTALTAETNAMLALNNVTWDDAGLYSVVVSNSTGSTISQPALLQ